MLQPGSICFRAFFYDWAVRRTNRLCNVRTEHSTLRIGCATYERSVPFCGSAVQRTDGAFHFADRLCNVRTEHSILRVGCAVYERSIPFYGSAVQHTGRQCKVRTSHSALRMRDQHIFLILRMKSRIFIIAYNSGCLVLFIGGNYKRENIWLNILRYSKSFQSSLRG